MKCLLVDDETGIREGLAALLRRKGHEVVTAGDCAAARTALAAEPFDAVVTDWRLPDGTAAAFVVGCPCPVVAISGHPEEVDAGEAVRTVLTKPVLPSRLFELLGELARAPQRRIDAALPRDVALLLDRALTLLGRPPAAHVVDDGVFVTLTAPLSSAPDGSPVLTRLEELGGDLRVLAPGGALRVELRWCRDGRPDLGLEVRGVHESWPATGEFVVDFHGAPADPVLFADCLDRAVAVRSRGGMVHFLNAPAALHSWASDQGRAHDMPMKARVGPRLPAVLADLWSQP